ncbi:hypothetical protein [Escherichia coli]|uniref:hypothetical protein n=1 Tax=Escherichia coli TaxID=562 RepID=UPI0037DC1D29
MSLCFTLDDTLQDCLDKFVPYLNMQIQDKDNPIDESLTLQFSNMVRYFINAAPTTFQIWKDVKPVYSIHGRTSKPVTEFLENLDKQTGRLTSIKGWWDGYDKRWCITANLKS